MSCNIRYSLHIPRKYGRSQKHRYAQMTFMCFDNAIHTIHTVRVIKLQKPIKHVSFHERAIEIDPNGNKSETTLVNVPMKKYSIEDLFSDPIEKMLKSLSINPLYSGFESV